MRSLLTIAFGLASASLLSAHPGHGVVDHDTQPIVHHFTSLAHLGSIALAVAAITVIALLGFRLLTDGSRRTGRKTQEAGQSGCN